MTRSFSAFVAQTPNPEAVRNNAVQQFGDGCEVATPRQDVPNRVRVECSGIPDFRSKIDALGPVDWAVAIEESDVPGHHDRVEVFDGAEWIDEFVGYGFSGDTVEAYLERFHGILVDSAGPYLNSWQFDPSLALAAENPEETLAESPPKPPFEVTCDDYWVVAEADTNDPVQFEETFVDELVNTECVHERSATSAHDWATDDPITVEFVEPTTDSADRVRARVPLAFGGLYNRSGAGVDIDLRIDLETFGKSLNWICFFYGNVETGRVTAWLFAGQRRLTWEEAVDSVIGQKGRNGADVAAYFERYYGFDLDPTVSGIEMSRLDDTEVDDEPEEYSYDLLEEHGVDYSPRTE